MAEKKEKPTHQVARAFRDLDNFDTEHAVGDDVSHLPAERLEKLVANGHVTDLKAEADAKAKAEAQTPPAA